MNYMRSLPGSSQREVELCLVGLAQAGKTSIVKALSIGEFKEHTVPTVGFQMSRFRQNGVDIKTWDLGGMRRFHRMWLQYCRSVQVIVFVVDSSSPNTFFEAKEALLTLLQEPELDQIPLLVLGNKIDLPDAEPIEAIITALDLGRVAQSRKTSSWAVSCKTKENLNEVLAWITQQCN